MNVIIHFFHRVYLKFESFCDLAKYFFQSLRHSIIEQFLPIFWYPYEKILQIIDTMVASLSGLMVRIVTDSYPDFVRIILFILRLAQSIRSVEPFKVEKLLAISEWKKAI